MQTLPNDLFDSLQSLQPDRSQTAAFIAALTGSAHTPLTFQTFAESPGLSIPARILHGTLDQAWDELVAYNRRGCGVFFMVNSGDGCGRSTHNVTAIRALFIDEDGKDSRAAPDGLRTRPNKPPSQLALFTGVGKPPFDKLAPTITVQSANGQHNYWCLAPGEFARELAAAKSDLAKLEADIAVQAELDCDAPHTRSQLNKWRNATHDTAAAAFERAQRTLAAHFNTDPSVCDLPRVLRLPGLFHLKNPAQPFLVRLAAPASEARYSVTEVLQAYPAPTAIKLERHARAPIDLANMREYPPASADLLESARRYMTVCEPVVSGMAGGGDRTAYKYAAVLLNDWALTETEAAPIWDAKCRGHERFDEGWRDEKFSNAFRYATKPYGCKRDEWLSKQPAPDAKREVYVSRNQTELVDQTIAALARADSIYQRGNRLVRVVSDTRKTTTLVSPRRAARIEKVPSANLAETIGQQADFVYYAPKTNSFSVGAIPTETLLMLEARSQWPGVRDLEGVVESPVLRPDDGSVLQTPGYDLDTGLYYSPIERAPIDVPLSPTLEDAKTSVAELLKVVADFPFDADTEHPGLYQSCWLAAVLTPFARFAFPGPAPLFLADANIRGAGKGKLMDCAGIIAFGREVAKSVYPDSDEEMRKAITAYALEGRRYIYYDNLKRPLGSPSLDCALTTTVWSDRVLGESASTGETSLYAVWYATGNNVSIEADTARRVLHIRLNSPHEQPENRGGFKHTDLLSWVRAERPTLAAHALTILRAYFVAGLPEPKPALDSWGSFEGWSLIRKALVWAGQPDPALSRKRLAERSDMTGGGLETLVHQLLKNYPAGAKFTAGDLRHKVESEVAYFSDLRNALCELAGKPFKDLTSEKVGRLLSGFAERVVSIGPPEDRRKYRLAYEKTERGRLYWVDPVTVH